MEAARAGIFRAARSAPPNASRKAEAEDVAEAFGVPDRVVKGRGPELPHTGQKPIPVAWRFFAVPAADGHHPSAALQRQHQAAAAVGINDQIDGQRLAFSVAVLKADRDDRRPIRRRYQVADAATRAAG